MVRVCRLMWPVRVFSIGDGHLCRHLPYVGPLSLVVAAISTSSAPSSYNAGDLASIKLIGSCRLAPIPLRPFVCSFDVNATLVARSFV